VEAIAGEKAGIIKSNIPVVVSPQHPPCWMFFGGSHEKEKHRWSRPGKILEFAERRSNLEKTIFPIRYRLKFLDELETRRRTENCDINQYPLLGKHQMENAGTAFCALKILQEKGFTISIVLFRKV
jgi:dihydrofolate synthase/folylpolyglutamate synthase